MNTYTVNGKMITIRTPQGMQTYVWAESEADAIILHTELCRLSVMLEDRKEVIHD